MGFYSLENFDNKKLYDVVAYIKDKQTNDDS
jgi:hypothetical protein